MKNLKINWGRLGGVLALFFMAGCSGAIDTPFGTQTVSSLRASNLAALARIDQLSAQKDGLIRIGLIADSHQNYSDLERVVGELNRQDLDFVVHLGDFTNIGVSSEFDAFARLMAPLRHPLLVVIGNHDAVGAGPRLFEKLFGPFNQSVDFAGRRFLLYNSNSLEFRARPGYVPAWRERQLRDSNLPVYLFQHVNEDNTTHFSAAEIAATEDLYVRSTQLQFSFNGHMHGAGFRVKNEVARATIPRTEGGQYGILEIDSTEDRLWFCRLGRCAEPRVVPHRGSVGSSFPGPS